MIGKLAFVAIVVTMLLPSFVVLCWAIAYGLATLVFSFYGIVAVAVAVVFVFIGWRIHHRESGIGNRESGTGNRES